MHAQLQAVFSEDVTAPSWPSALITPKRPGQCLQGYGTCEDHGAQGPTQHSPAVGGCGDQQACKGPKSCPEAAVRGPGDGKEEERSKQGQQVSKEARGFGREDSGMDKALLG